MKNDFSRRFYSRVVVNMLYSTMIACLVEVFLITNVDLVVNYLEEDGSYPAAVRIFRLGTATTVLYVVIGIGIFALSFLLLQRRSMRYIGKIAAAIQNISEGDLNTQIEIQGDDEFAAMAANLSRMEEDIRELMDLLSKGGPQPPEVQQKYIDIAYTKAKRLEKLIEELFGFTKMSCGKVSMNVGKVDIVKLLGQLLEEFYPSFADHHLTYELTSNVPALTITADGNLLARLFDNLIGNAIKYGAQGKKVLVKILSEGEIVTVSVINYGYVIPAEELPLIFNKFYRVEQSRSLNTGGTGLGLAIAKNIVDMHGGTISVSSDLNGTVFTVKLKTDFDVSRENFRTIE